MKNNLLFTTYAVTVLFLFCNLNGNAQKGIYVSAGVGYGFNAGTDNHYYLQYPLGYAGIFTGYDETHSYSYYPAPQSDVTSDDAQVVEIGFGKGFNLTGVIGYKLNEHFSTEVGVFYLSGNSFTTTHVTNSTFYSTTDTFYYNESVTTKLTTDGRIRLIPTIKITAIRSFVTPYIKAGIILGIGGTIIYNHDSYFSATGAGDSSNSYELKSTGGLSLGFNSAFGAEYSLSEKVNIFAEVGLILESWSPARGEITKYEQNLVNRISYLTSTTFEYSDNVSQTSAYNNSNKVNITKEYLEQSYPFSSWGFNIGLKFDL